MGNRQYVPGLGRFIEVDPVEGGSANDYDDTSRDPRNATDIDGNKATFILGVAAFKVENLCGPCFGGWEHKPVYYKLRTPSPVIARRVVTVHDTSGRGQIHLRKKIRDWAFGTAFYVDKCENGYLQRYPYYERTFGFVSRTWWWVQWNVHITTADVSSWKASKSPWS